MTSPHAFEDDIRQTALDARADYTRQLEASGLEARIALSKAFRDGRLNAELLIQFFHNNELVDALEGTVIRDSADFVPMEELRSWLHEGLSDVISRRGKQA